jgi:hypothetical protein
MTTAELVVPVAWAGTCHLAMWTAGTWIRPKIAPPADEESCAERAFLTAMLGFALLGTSAMLLACLRLLYAPLLIGCVSALAAAGAFRLYRSWPKALPRPSVASSAWLVPAVAVLAYVPGSLHPVLLDDENVYHLFLPKLYLAAHRIVALPWNFHANMPHQIDLAYVWSFVIGSSGSTRVFVLGFVLWTIVGLASIARRMVGAWGPAIAALVYLSGANVRWHFGVANIEPVLGALLLGAVVALEAAWRRGPEHLRAFAILVGAACASKYTAWLYGAVLFVAASVSVLRSPGPLRRLAGGLAILAAIVAVPVIPWIIKDAVITGNPVYPSLYSLLDGAHWSEIQALHVTRSLAFAGGPVKPWWSYPLLPVNLVLKEPEVFFGANCSASLMALFIAAMVFPWRSGEPSVRLRLIALGGFAAWAASVQHARYLVAWIPVMALTACCALAWVRRFSFAPLVAIVSILGLVGAQMLWRPDVPRLRFEVFHASREELLRQDPSWDLATVLNRIVPPGGTVLGMWADNFYHLDHPAIADTLFESPVVLAALREAGDAGAFARQMAQAGVTHVVLGYDPCERFVTNAMAFNLLDPRVYPETRLHADIELLHGFVREHLEPLPGNDRWRVFRLKEADLNNQ